MNETASALLVAARTCVGRKGLAGTTSRDIAREAGANLAAITYHFGSKDELVARALLEGFRAWLAPALDVLGGSGDPAARTVAAVQALVVAVEEHPDAGGAYVQALAHAAVADPLRAGITGLWAELRQLLAEDIRSLRASGELGAWVDPDVMAAVLVAVATGLLVQATVDPGGPPVPAMAAQLAGLLLAAREPR